MCFNEDSIISPLNGKPLKFVDKLVAISQTKIDDNIHIDKKWTPIGELKTVREVERPDRIKRKFFLPVIMLVLLYSCTTWSLRKRLRRKLDGNYTRMLHAILNKSKKKHPTKQQLYGHLPPISQTIQERRARHASHFWSSKNELTSDLLLWTPTHGHTSKNFRHLNIKTFFQLSLKATLRISET